MAMKAVGLRSAVLLVAALGWAAAAQAASYASQFVNSGTAELSPVIQAGAPPDSPGGRVDPNVPTSPFAGVVSINIRYIDEVPGSPTFGQQLSFICSGTAITAYHVLTAGHCVDPLDNGVVVDITKVGNDVRVILNNDAVFNPATDLITANKVTINPNYEGFAICPDGTSNCVNDDIAILRLSAPLPVEPYHILQTEVSEGSVFTMVGYGRSGDGINGYTVAPNFFVKREGANIYDLTDTDDEQNFDPSSPAEVWYYDFDGIKNGQVRDTFCLLGLECSAWLANDVETHLGGGDSGGPSFIVGADGKYYLVANNTFGINFCYGNDCTSGDFGDGGGGVLLYSYLDWIRSTAIPEPGSLALAGLALLALGGARRRRQRD